MDKKSTAVKAEWRKYNKNTWAVSVVRCTAGIFNWTLNELKDMDRKTRKLMTMNHALQPKANVDRLYVSKNHEGREMMSIEECVRIEECSLSGYVKRTDKNKYRVLDSFVKENTAAGLKNEQLLGRTDG